MRCVAQANFFDADLRLLTDVVRGLKALCSHLPECRRSGKVYARHVEVELLFRFGRIHNGEGQVLVVWSERSEHVERISRAARVRLWLIATDGILGCRLR